jgi:thioesterase domain-containing protein
VSISVLLQTLRDRGVELVPAGDRLRTVGPKGAITPELAQQIRDRKAELLELLSGAGDISTASAEIPRVAERHRYPLSAVQRRNAFSGHQGLGLRTAFRLRGPLVVETLRQTVEHIVRRHAPLRSVLELGVDPPQQLVQEDHELAFRRVALTGAEDPEQALEAALQEASSTPFDLQQGPAYRFILFELGPSENVLFFGVSPVVFDGWSFDVIIKELCAGYAALAAGRPWPFPDPPIEYVDFLSWQRDRLEQRRAVEEAFWRESLGTTLPAPPLPTDRPRPPVPTHRGKRIAFGIPAPLTEALRDLAQRRGTTVQMLLFAATHVLLARLADHDRVVVATPVDGRYHPAVEALIGSFVKLLLVPSNVDFERPFTEFVADLHQRSLGAYDNHEVPIEELGLRLDRRGASGVLPLWQVEFSYQQVDQRSTLMGPVSLAQLNLVTRVTAPSEFILWVKDAAQKLTGAIDFAQDVFDEATIVHWRDAYSALLASIVAAPETPIGKLSLLDDGLQTAVDEAVRRAISGAPAGVVPAGATSEELASATFVDVRGERLPAGTWGYVRAGANHGARQARLSLGGELAERAEATPETRPRETPARVLVIDHVEARVIWAFSAALGVDLVDLHTDFFDAGGHSLAGVRLLGSVHADFGVRLALGVLFEAPTPYLLAKRVRAAAGLADPDTGEASTLVNEWSPIVPIQPRGALPPLFVVAGVGGNPMNLRDLARALGSSQPFYGLQHRGTDGRLPPHASVREMAEEYAAHIVRTHPSGPYLLGGFSAGGVAAFETAQVLREQGRSVALVAMFDANSPIVQRLTRRERLERHFAALRVEGGPYLVEVARRALERRIERVRRVSRALLARWRPYEYRNDAVTNAWLSAVRRYRPQPYAGDVLVLRARTRDNGTYDPTNGWGPLVKGALEIRDVDGGHTTHLLPEFAPGVARELAAALAAVRERMGVSSG